MTAHSTRFGVNLVFAGTVAQTVEDAKRAADVGFDVVMVGDHLGSPAPLPTLVAVAAAVPSVRISNLVLNAPLYQPALLARDLATVDAASGGRLEIALGSGYIAADFAGFGLPFPSAAQRVEVLTKHVTTIRTLLSSPDYRPAPVQSPPPILVAGIGDKMLSMAAQHADIIAIAAQGHKDQLGERIDYIKNHAGPRFEQIEFAFSFFQLSFNKTPDLTLLRSTSPKSTDEELLQSVTLLQGSVSGPPSASPRCARSSGSATSPSTSRQAPRGRTSKNCSPPPDNYPWPNHTASERISTMSPSTTDRHRLADKMVWRVGYGAMRLAGDGLQGPPLDRGEALAVLRAAIDAGVDHIDTAQFYGPGMANELIREALFPYPEGLALVSKVGARRDESGHIDALATTPTSCAPASRKISPRWASSNSPR